MTAQYWVSELNMQPHPEGGYFAETYRSAETIPSAGLPERFSGPRSFGTAIYFLLESHHFSSLHRIQSDEIWHYYAGRPLNVYVISPAGDLSLIRLGNNPERGEVFQAVVSAGCWFGSRPIVDSTVVDSTLKETGYSLVGCTVAPGFDFADFELARRNELLRLFPQHAELIRELANE